MSWERLNIFFSDFGIADFFFFVGLIAGEDEIEVVISAAREVADPKGFISMKDITKLLLPEEKEERWEKLKVFRDAFSSIYHSPPSVGRRFEACKLVIVVVSGGLWTSFLT